MDDLWPGEKMLDKDAQESLQEASLQKDLLPKEHMSVQGFLKTAAGGPLRGSRGSEKAF